MSAITLPVVFGSLNAKGLIDDRYTRAGVKLGCPRVSSLDGRLRPIYTVFSQRSDPRWTKASCFLQTLQEAAALDQQNLAELSAEVALMHDPCSPFELDLRAGGGDQIALSFEYPLTWSAVKLVKMYDDIMCMIQFLYSTGSLQGEDPLLVARKLRQRAGMPVRRFLTRVSRDVASVDFL